MFHSRSEAHGTRGRFICRSRQQRPILRSCFAFCGTSAHNYDNYLIKSCIFPFVGQQSYVEEFFVTLALCHTVQLSVPTSQKREVHVNHRPGYVNNTFHPDHFDYEYQASSPDEKALVEAWPIACLIFNFNHS